MYIIVSWWTKQRPENVTMVPEAEKITDEKLLEEKAQKKKKQLGPGSEVFITKVIKRL